MDISQELRMKVLSLREKEVLELIVAGFNNLQIAKKLHVSENTIKAHLKSIFKKLNVDNRIRAAVMAVKNNLV